MHLKIERDFLSSILLFKVKNDELPKKHSFPFMQTRFI